MPSKIKTRLPQRPHSCGCCGRRWPLVSRHVLQVHLGAYGCEHLNVELATRPVEAYSPVLVENGGECGGVGRYATAIYTANATDDAARAVDKGTKINPFAHDSKVASAIAANLNSIREMLRPANLTFNSANKPARANIDTRCEIVGVDEWAFIASYLRCHRVLPGLNRGIV